jgi:hypothetical protein
MTDLSDPRDFADLEARLTDLGEHLDHPDAPDLASVVVARIAAGGAAGRRGRSRSGRHVDRRALVAAAAIVALALALVSYGPSRTAIAQWLGIGVVEVRDDPDAGTRPDGSNPFPGHVSTPGGSSALPAVSPNQIIDAGALAGLTVQLPTAAGIGAPTAVSAEVVDGGGVVAVTYRDFTLVEMRGTGERPLVSKTNGPGTRAEDTLVNLHPALWITGSPHEVAYIGVDGDLHIDSVRRAGDVLLWVVDGVTYRVEGVTDQAEARRIAESGP